MRRMVGGTTSRTSNLIGRIGYGYRLLDVYADGERCTGNIRMPASVVTESGRFRRNICTLLEFSGTLPDTLRHVHARLLCGDHS